jgi:single-strand DNA-binding protein
MLRVSLLCNMGADPEVRYTQKGAQITTVRVAVNQVRTGPDGERQENTEWFRVRVSGRQGEFVQRLSKGTRVLVIGRLDIGHYQSKEGEPRTSFDVWADDVQAMSTRGAAAEPEGMLESYAEASAPVAAAAGVSSLGGTPAARTSTNGKGARPGTRTEPASAEGGGEDLEELPF